MISNKKFYITCTLLILSASESVLVIQLKENLVTELLKTVEYIVDEYYIGSSTPLTVMVQDIDSSDLANLIMKHVESTESNMVSTHTNITEDVDLKQSERILLFMNDVNSYYLECLSNMSSEVVWKMYARFTIVLTGHLESGESIQKLLKKSWEDYGMLNVIIVSASGIFTYNQFKRANVVKDILESVKNKNLFPEKLNNTYGYPFIVAVKESFQSGNDNVNGLPRLEYPMMHAINEAINGTLEIFSTSDKEYWDNVNNMPFPKKPTILGNANIKHQDNIHSSTVPQELQCIKYIVPKSGRMPTYMNVILPFRKATWTLYFGLIPIFIFFWKLIRLDMKLESLTSTEIIKILLTGSTGICPGKLSNRMFMTWCLIYSLLMLNSYQGALSSFLTKPQFYPDIDTSLEIVDKGLRVAVNPVQGSDMSRLVETVDLTDPTTATISSRAFFPKNVTEVLYNISRYKDMLYITVDIYAQFFVHSGHFYEGGYPLLHIASECLFVFLPTFDLPGLSSYIERFDMIFSRIASAGLFVKYVKDYLFHGKLSGRSNIQKPSFLEPLRFDHILTPCLILLSGLLLSVAIFIAENTFKIVDSLRNKAKQSIK